MSAGALFIAAQSLARASFLLARRVRSFNNRARVLPDAPAATPIRRGGYDVWGASQAILIFVLQACECEIYSPPRRAASHSWRLPDL